MIALPWLVLKLTNDALALGTVLALIGIPRALFMLVGGVASDRYTPRTVMLVSDLLRLLLTVLLTAMILTSLVHLWMLYILAIAFGVISGFFNPASGAMMPLLVNPEELAVSNSIYQGTSQLSLFVGPVLAGGLIALFAHAKTGQGNEEMTGIAVAVAIDALSFLISAATLWGIKLKAVVSNAVMRSGNLFASIRAGIEYVWRDPLLRSMFILMVAANFLFSGPMLVGIPVLADSRLAGGAAAYGTIMGAYGGGNLLGILITGSLILWLNRWMGPFLVGVIVSFGVALGLMAVVQSTYAAFAILLVVGTGNGVLAITLITFLQRKTPQEMLGRVMSLVQLAGVGLVPISQALSGAMIKLSLSGLFFGAGILMILVAVWLAGQPATRKINQVLAASAPEQ
jgi:MFS family permease